MLRFYNTLTGCPEEFVPLEERQVKFYHCGPTVYWVQHIGNLRAMTIGDLLVRSLRYFGYRVTHVRNYTDVGHLTSDADTGEDKMEKGAKRDNLTPQEIAQKYINIFETDTRAINLVEPNFKPRPSQLIPEIIAMVKTLLDKGYAYTTDLAVYFEIEKFPNYTRLSRQKPQMNLAGGGKGEVKDPAKKNPADFALWFFKAGRHAHALQTWPSPFISKLIAEGQGFPGWHIECSVMVKKYLGETIDIHLGGVEHISVHHTNEIAQSEAANGLPFVRYWLHNEHLVVAQEKMAKSTDTGFSLTDVVKHGFEPLALRYFYLTAHYRSRQNFTWEAIAHAARSLEELRSLVSNLRNQRSHRSSLSQEKLNKNDEYRQKFDEALENDLNLPQALAVVWEMFKSNIPSFDKYDLAMGFDEVLGLNLSEPVSKNQESKTIPEEINDLVKQREQLRQAGKFTKADQLRKQIEARGFIVEDTSSGPEIKTSSII